MSHPRLPEVIAGRYRLVREVGRGGMAFVYLARDLKHDRDVAIKFIRPELAVSVGHERFQREIEIAARLRHPNIVPLYDSGEAGGAFYFVMPYEAGRSLRQRLTDSGPLGMAEALAVLRDVARALAHAHEHGVVHRDVKPDNVMLSGDAAVVTDFGIAKAVDAALTGPGASSLTQTGAGIGTPAYMAPEQAMGAPADHRADLYSLGCLAYEVFTGNPPFHGMHGPQIVAAHLTLEPEPVSARRTDVPPAVAAMIARCLQKDPAHRPSSAREVLGALDTGGTHDTPVPAPALRPFGVLRWVVPALVAGAVAAAAWIAKVDPEGGTGEPVTLAVLPFASLGADSTMRIVAEGLTDEVAGALARVPGIQVKSRNGALMYRGQLGVDLAEAGERLKADYLLTAIVRQVRGHWVLSADLARASDAASIWGDTVGLGPDRTAGAAETIANRLVAGLRSRFPAIGSAAPAAASSRTTNNEAYRLYLRGQERLARRGESVSESADLFREAIRLDSLFAPAWSGLSMALALFPFFEGAPSREVEAELDRSARRALALDPTLSLPHVSLGVAAWFEHRWDDAEREFRTAVELEPRNVEALVQYTRHLLFVRRPTEAMAQIQRARIEDPASALVLSWVAAGWFALGQLDSAMAESRRALETDSSNYSTVFVGSLIRLAANRPAEARRVIDGAPRAYLVNEYVIARSGDTATARQRLRELDAERPEPWLAESRRALAYLGLGDTARALTSLERASINREIWLLMVGEWVPMFDGIRASERYRALMRRIGLEAAAAPAQPTGSGAPANRP